MASRHEDLLPLLVGPILPQAPESSGNLLNSSEEVGWGGLFKLETLLLFAGAGPAAGAPVTRWPESLHWWKEQAA